MSPEPSAVVKGKIAEALLSNGELWELKSKMTSEHDQEIMVRAVQVMGSLVKEILAAHGLEPGDGARIYAEIMTTPDQMSREIYHKMNDHLKSEILIVNSKDYI